MFFGVMFSNVRRPTFGLFVAFDAVHAFVLAFVAVRGEVPTKLGPIVGANVVAPSLFAHEAFVLDAELLGVLTSAMFAHRLDAHVLSTKLALHNLPTVPVEITRAFVDSRASESRAFVGDKVFGWHAFVLAWLVHEADGAFDFLLVVAAEALVLVKAPKVVDASAAAPLFSAHVACVAAGFLGAAAALLAGGKGGDFAVLDHECNFSCMVERLETCEDFGVGVVVGCGVHEVGVVWEPVAVAVEPGVEFVRAVEVDHAGDINPFAAHLSKFAVIFAGENVNVRGGECLCARVRAEVGVFGGGRGARHSEEYVRHGGAG